MDNTSRRSETTIKVFVGSLPEGTTVDELKELFKPYGEIAECDVVNRCGFLHMEDKDLAFKAIEELNNTTFKGTRISVEKGRVKSRNGPGSRGGRGMGRGPMRGPGGPMRGGRDGFRGGPYSRDGGFDRRGPPRGGFGGGFDRGFGGRPPMDRGPGPMNNRPPMNGRGGPMNNRPPMNDGYGMGDRRMMNENRNGYGNQGYGGNMGGGDNMYNDNFNGGMGGGFSNTDGLGSRDPYARKPMNDNMGGMGERRQGQGMRSQMDNYGQGGGMGGGMDRGMGGGMGQNNMQGGYDRRPPQDNMFSRRDGASAKPMGGGGYGDGQRNNSYDTAYPPLQNRSYTGGAGPRRDMGGPPMRRF